MQRLRVAVAFVTLCALATALPAQTAQTRRAWTRPGELRFALAGLDPRSLNPLFSTSVQEDQLFALFSDLLVTVDERGRAVPELAARVPTSANGDISRDGRSITYRLRRGVKWHDGVTFTSRDVRFSWQAVMNPRNNVASREAYDVVERVDTPDDYTAILRLKRPFAPAVLTIFGGGQTLRLVPQHVLAKYADVNAVDFNQHPIGTGPFKVVAWKRGQSVELEANDAYFLGKPKLRRVTVQLVPATTTAGVMLETHETDFAQLDSSTYQRVRDNPNLRVVLANYYAFIGLPMNVTRPALRDVRVRRAIVYALDRVSLNDKNTFGTGVLADSDLNPISWAHTNDVVHYPHDPARATALLEAAGWRAGSDGVRQKNGARLALELAEPSGGTTARNEDVQVQEMLRRVGIEVTIKGYAPSLLYAPAEAGGILESGKFDLTISGWVSGGDPDNSTLYMCRYAGPAGQNYSRYCSSAMDAAQEQALATYDTARRKRAYAAIERLASQDLPFVFVYWPKARFAMNPDLRGFAPNGVTPTWNAYTWSI